MRNDRPRPPGGTACNRGVPIRIGIVECVFISVRQCLAATEPKSFGLDSLSLREVNQIDKI